MKTFTFCVRQLSLAFFIVLFSMFAAVAQTTVSRAIDPEAPAAGVASPVSQTTPYILNQPITTAPQNANFNISGTGKANIFDATLQFNIGGSRVFSVTESDSTFVGKGAGATNTGVSNSFFGVNTGSSNGKGMMNSFFGREAGVSNLDGRDNSFFGADAGRYTDSGSSNSFFGYSAGKSNSFGNNNTILGAEADVEQPTLSYATAIGSGALVGASNTIVLGRRGGVDSVSIPGIVQLEKLGSAGSAHLCRNKQQKIAACSSSLRYKTNILPFRSGLTLLQRLRPIRFEWKDGGMKDVGFGAEDVAKVEPLLVTYNDKGEIEGVKYEKLATVLVNAVKEQQAQIEAQRRQIDALKKLMCGQNPDAEVCKK